MPDNARRIVEDLLGPSTTREIWSGSYDKVLPVSVQDFELSSISAKKTRSGGLPMA